MLPRSALVARSSLGVIPKQLLGRRWKKSRTRAKNPHEQPNLDNRLAGLRSSIAARGFKRETPDNFTADGTAFEILLENTLAPG